MVENTGTTPTHLQDISTAQYHSVLEKDTQVIAARVLSWALGGKVWKALLGVEDVERGTKNAP